MALSTPSEALLMNDPGFVQVKPRATADNKGRITIGATTKGKGYRVYENSAGQILLDPLVDISQHELQLLAEPEKLKEWQALTRDVEIGHLEDRGSFSEYVD